MSKYLITSKDLVVDQFDLGQYFPKVAANWHKPLPPALISSLGLVLQVDVVPVQSLEQKRAELHEIVAQKRVEAQARNLVYLFSDGQTGTIQTRNDRDLLNINGRVSAAMIVKAQNITDPVLSFRDEENITHFMTADAMLAMGMAVSSFVDLTYGQKWAHDAAIDAWDGVSAYDVTTGWN